MIKVLIIGAGRIAGLNEKDNYRKKPCTHYGAFASNQEFKVLGVVDVDKNRASYFADQFKIKYYYTDIEKAIENVRPDLISIAVPYKFHYDIVKTICQNKNKPRMIFCEKPIADSVSKATEMGLLCKNNNVRLFVNNRRLTPIYRDLRKVIKKEFGNNIITINTWCSSGLHAIGIHMIELLRMVIGEIIWVYAIQENEQVESLPFSANFEPDDPRVQAMIGFKNGIVGNFINSALTSFTYFEIEILCRNGKIRVSDNGEKFEYWKPEVPGKSTLSYKLGDPKIIKASSSQTLFAEIASSIAENIDTGNDHPLSAQHGIESYRVLDAMVRSANTGKRIQLK
jgi:predicted dehydrogenase